MFERNIVYPLRYVCVCVCVYTCMYTHTSKGQMKLPMDLLYQSPLYFIETESLPEPGGRLAASWPQCSSVSASRDAGAPGMDSHAQLYTDWWDLNSDHVFTVLSSTKLFF